MMATSEELAVWRDLCEWLDAQKYKAAYRTEMPERYRPLVYRGGNETGRRAREAREHLRLIFYYEGWGWRLRKGWRARLEELERGLSVSAPA